MQNKGFAFLFPGQGAQHVGMGRCFYDTFLTAKEVFQYADDWLHFPLTRLIFSGDERHLAEVKYCQIAVYVVSMAIMRVLEEQCAPLGPSISSGLSLGEYSALVASRRIPWETGLSLVQTRAQAMHKANLEAPGTLAVVWGLSAQRVRELGFWVTNICTPDQVVIAGSHTEIQRAKVKLVQRGAKKVTSLSVQGAFHSKKMQTALPYLQEAFQHIALQASDIPMVMNVSGKVEHASDVIKHNLLLQTTQPVNWYACLQTLDSCKIGGYITMGPGQTLCGLNRKLKLRAPTINIQKVRDLEKVMQYETVNR